MCFSEQTMSLCFIYMFFTVRKNEKQAKRVYYLNGLLERHIVMLNSTVDIWPAAWRSPSVYCELHVLFRLIFCD